MMIAVDSCSWIAYFGGEQGADVEWVDQALAGEQAVLSPVVLAELLSDPFISEHKLAAIKSIPVLAISESFWENVGLLRAKVLKKGRKARLSDIMVAQVCLEHQIPLITRDKDFIAIHKIIGLQLYTPSRVSH